MINAICLDDKYSTTKFTTQEKPEIVSSADDKFGSVLLLPEGEGRKGEGGLRTKGYFKTSYEDKPIISIVTVVYNGEKHIEKTIQSVITQTYDNIEYIIIDGGSTDGTLDIIKKFENFIDYWVSERDNGIYDAMNKGIDLASGGWINFMNAGDSFYTYTIIEDIFTKNSCKNIDIIYGDHNVVYPYKTKISQAGSIEKIWKGSQFCHQSSFISAKTHKRNKYNLQNRIGADFELFYSLYRQNKAFKYINTVIANYSAGGFSDVKRVDSIVGCWNVVEKNTMVNIYYLWIVLKELVKIELKKMIHYNKYKTP
ncbi:MAG: glycosyltransferase family 2 protein [Desulfobacterium sp.]|nr:glycosyltransferase family 2 protein [Desulfobacterium sp.]